MLEFSRVSRYGCHSQHSSTWLQPRHGEINAAKSSLVNQICSSIHFLSALYWSMNGFFRLDLNYWGADIVMFPLTGTEDGGSDLTFLR